MSDSGTPGRRQATLGTLLAGLVACVSLGPKEPPARFELGAELDDGEVVAAGAGPVVEVAPPTAAPGFDGPRMVYVRRPHELEYFATSEWVDAPARMLAPLLARALARSGRFEAVVQAHAAPAAALRLESQVLRLQHEFTERPSRVRLTVHVQLSEVASRRVLGAREFEAVEEAPSEDPYGGVVAANRAARGCWTRSSRTASSSRSRRPPRAESAARRSPRDAAVTDATHFRCMAAPRVHFQSASAFRADLGAAVQAHFASTGASQRGDRRMHRKTAVLFVWLAASYAAAVFAPVPWPVRALLTVSVGLAMAGIGFGVMHDANHGAYSERPRVNRALGLSLDLLGGSSWYWKMRHNGMHHTYTNVSGLDSDIDGNALLRFAPDRPRRWFHRGQHVYVWLLYAVYPLGWWLIDDFHRLATQRLGEARAPRPRGGELAAFVATKVAFLGWAFVVPAAVHRSWAVIPFTLLAVGTLGVTLATVFQLAHCVGEADFHPAGSADLQADWAVHQVSTTVDFARGSAVLGWYLGGLNFQIEHHLFPKVCHVHYRALAPIVAATCARHGVPYRSQPTLGAAVRANVAWLRRLGAEDAPLRPGALAAAR